MYQNTPRLRKLIKGYLASYERFKEIGSGWMADQQLTKLDHYVYELAKKTGWWDEDRKGDVCGINIATGRHDAFPSIRMIP